jgi:hypothetical protein
VGDLNVQPRSTLVAERPVSDMVSTAARLAWFMLDLLYRVAAKRVGVGVPCEGHERAEKIPLLEPQCGSRSPFLERERGQVKLRFVEIALPCLATTG